MWFVFKWYILKHGDVSMNDHNWWYKETIQAVMLFGKLLQE